MRGIIYGSVTVVNSVFTGNYSGDHGIIHKKAVPVKFPVRLFPIITVPIMVL